MSKRKKNQKDKKSKKTKYEEIISSLEKKIKKLEKTLDEDNYKFGLFYKEKKDYENQYYYFLKASKNNHIQSNFELGIMFLYGQYINKDIDKAIKYFKHAATYNCSCAYCFLAEIFYDKNIEESIGYYKKAVKLNNNNACNNLATIYNNNEKYKNDKESFRLFELAAKDGHKFAQCNLANMYRKGIGIGVDFKKAVYWYKKAADQNNLKAKYNLSMMYINYGNDNNKKKGKNMLEELADQNYGKAIEKLKKKLI
jgi:TPR repeat protein